MRRSEERRIHSTIPLIIPSVVEEVLEANTKCLWRSKRVIVRANRNRIAVKVADNLVGQRRRDHTGNVVLVEEVFRIQRR